MTKIAITSAVICTLERWDAGHVIECMERVQNGLHPDIRSASRFIMFGRDKKGYGLLDLLDKAADIEEEKAK